MKRATKWLGNGIRVVTLLLCVLAIFASISRAQVRPGGGGPPRPGPPPMPGPVIPPRPPGPVIPPPIIRPPGPPMKMGPQNTKYWYCSRCRATLSIGDIEPVHIKVCPQCGIRFTDGGGNFAPGAAPANNAPPLVAPDDVANGQPDNLNGAQERGNSRSLVWLVVGIAAVFFVLFVLAAGGFVAYMLLRSPSKPTKKGWDWKKAKLG